MEYIRTKCRNPTYISALDDSYSDVVLYRCKYAVEKLDNSSFVDESDLTGTPLTLEIGNATTRRYAWTKEEENHYPLPHPVCRQLLQDYFQSFNVETKTPNGNELLQVWCLCKSLDNVIAIGKQNTGNQLQIKRIKYLGLSSRNQPLLQIKTIKENHLNFAGKHCGVNCRVDCQFNILGHSHSHLENSALSSIVLKSSWNDLNYNVPAESSTSELIAQIRLPETSSTVCSLWQQLMYLDQCIDFVLTENSTFPTPLAKRSEYMPDVLVDELNTMSDDLILKYRENDISSPEYDIVRDFSGIGCDNLWTLLQNVKSLEELRECWNEFFCSLSCGNLKSFFVQGDGTSVSKIVTGLQEHTCAVPILKGKQAVEYLIEIGQECLKKFYVDLSVKYALRLKSQILNLFGKVCTEGNQKQQRKNLTVDKDSLCFRQKILVKLHIVMELLLMVKMHTGISHGSFESLARHAFEKFVLTSDQCPDSVQDLIANPSIRWACPVSTEHIPQVESLSVLSWRATLTTHSEATTYTTVHHQSRNPIFPTSLLDQSEIESSEESDFIFHCSEMQSVMLNVGSA